MSNIIIGSARIDENGKPPEEAQETRSKLLLLIIKANCPFRIFMCIQRDGMYSGQNRTILQTDWQKECLQHAIIQILVTIRIKEMG